MDDKNGFLITNRDRVLRAWEDSTELTRNFELYSQEMGDNKRLAEMFAKFAEDEAVHAANFLKVLKEME
jgi:rubrerythrin